jgi:hypothetical protein
MSLEFPEELREIGDFYVECCDRDRVEYVSHRDLNPIDLGEAIKIGLQEYGVSSIDIPGGNYMAGNYWFEHDGNRFGMTIIRIPQPTLRVYRVYVERKQTDDWRIKFKELLSNLEEILESV